MSKMAQVGGGSGGAFRMADGDSRRKKLQKHHQRHLLSDQLDHHRSKYLTVPSLAATPSLLSHPKLHQDQYPTNHLARRFADMALVAVIHDAYILILVLRRTRRMGWY